MQIRLQISFEKRRTVRGRPRCRLIVTELCGGARRGRPHPALTFASTASIFDGSVLPASQSRHVLLSYEFLMEELARLGDLAAAKGRVILPHLGNSGSLATVRDGKSID